MKIIAKNRNGDSTFRRNYDESDQCYSMIVRRGCLLVKEVTIEKQFVQCFFSPNLDTLYLLIRDKKRYDKDSIYLKNDADKFDGLLESLKQSIIRGNTTC